MESLEDWSDSLRNSEKTVLVEGKKDKISLSKLGIKNIYTVSSKPIYKVLEDLSNSSEVIILTDLDSEGKKIFSKLRHQFQKNGIKIDNNYRNFLYKKTKITQIESIKC